MSFRKILFAVVLLLFAACCAAANNPIKAFIPGSYQQLLQENKGKGFMLVIWSLDCSTCIKDMQLLSTIHQNRPELKIIMLSTDEPSLSAEIETLLAKYHLADIENWVFADDNSQKLRFEIDPSWYSELPRTYFFSASHEREGISGALEANEYAAHFSKMHI